MRVLWLCNIMLPAVAEHLGREYSNKEGWLAGLSRKIEAENRDNHITLGVCFPVEKKEDGMRGEAAGLSYYGFYEDTVHPEYYRAALEGRMEKILLDFKPDVVHIFGTEYPHTLAMAKAWNKPERTLIGIQGLCFVYAGYYMADLPEPIQRRSLFRDVIKRDNLVRQQKKYALRGTYEKEALKNCMHVTGRTDWDREWTKKINPKARYHFMNETLRGQFYGPAWSYEACEKYSIFLSQGNYPIKGLHYMLRALPAIKEQFPKVHVYVAGDEIARYGTLKEKIKISSYGKYILELTEQYDLKEQITFLGKQNAEEMCNRYLKSHIFVSPSAIENSPNSVGEAMLLGMPVVSSDVGGVHNMLSDGREGLLYQTEKTDRLAACICRMFSDRDFAESCGNAARQHAQKTHDPQANYRRLMEIYHEINLCI